VVIDQGMKMVLMVTWTDDEDGAHAPEETPASRKHPGLHQHAVLQCCGNGHRLWAILSVAT
jgi:hypothetical protein